MNENKIEKTMKTANTTKKTRKGTKNYININGVKYSMLNIFMVTMLITSIISGGLLVNFLFQNMESMKSIINDYSLKIDYLNNQLEEMKTSNEELKKELVAAKATENPVIVWTWKTYLWETGKFLLKNPIIVYTVLSLPIVKSFTAYLAGFTIFSFFKIPYYDEITKILKDWNIIHTEIKTYDLEKGEYKFRAVFKEGVFNNLYAAIHDNYMPILEFINKIFASGNASGLDQTALDNLEKDGGLFRIEEIPDDDTNNDSEKDKGN